jgi:hypothetical protein
MEHFEDLRTKLFPHLDHEFTAYRGVLTFANGSRIIAGHFQAEKDIDGIIGTEYDVIGIEEATTLSAKKLDQIAGSCRSSKVLADGTPWRPRIYSTTNPGGVGHAWYKARFVTPFMNGAENDTRFVPARVTDNKYNNPEYRKVLEQQTGWQREAWLNGNWDLMAGQFFTTFRREVHVLADFDHTRAREWFAAMDYGFAHYTVILLGCTDGDGNVFIVDEHAERMWLPQRHVSAMRVMLSRYNLIIDELKRCVAGADVFSRQFDGTTIAQQYARAGLRLSQANMDRINGWAEVRDRLGEPDKGRAPKLFIHKRCARLVETLPMIDRKSVV